MRSQLILVLQTEMRGQEVPSVERFIVRRR